MGGKTFGFGAASAPVFGRKGDAPETRGRLQELHGYFGFTCAGLRGFHNLAPKFFARFDVSDGHQLAAGDAFVQMNQCAMSIDHGGKGFLGESVSIGQITGNDDSNGEHDTMAAPLIRIFLLADRNGSHKSSPCLPVRGKGLNSTPLEEQFANQYPTMREKFTGT